MKRQVEVIRERKTGRLITGQVKQVIQIYDAMTYMDLWPLPWATGCFYSWMYLDR